MVLISLDAFQKIEDTLNDAASDSYGRIGNADYKAALDFVVPDSVDSTDADAINSYLDRIKKYFTWEDGGRTGLDISQFCKDAVDAGLMVLDESGENYTIAGQTTMEDFAEGLGLSLPLVQAVFGEMEEFGAQFDWSDEAVKTLGDLAVEATAAAEGLRNLGFDGGIDIDVSDAATAEEAIQRLNDTIASTQEIKGSVDIDSQTAEDANAILRYCLEQLNQLEAPAIMDVDTSLLSGKIGEAVSLLQQFQVAQDQLREAQTLGIDTSGAQAQLDDITAKIQALDTNVTTTLQVDTTDASTIQASLDAMDYSVLVKANIDESAIIGYTSEDKTLTVTTTVDESAVTAFQGKNIDRDATVTYNCIHSAVDIYDPSNLTRYVNYYIRTIGSTPSDSSGGSSRAMGTAMAGGNWGAKQGGKTLVGELGEEIIVSPKSGKWYTVGTNGPEFVNVPKGAIVFNHLQTEDLLRDGNTLGRALSLANGTALAMGNAMVTGGISVGQANKSTGNYSGSSGSSSSRESTSGYSKKSTSSKSSTTQAADDAADSVDWITIAIDRLERAIKRLGITASSTYKDLKTRLNATYDKMLGITNEIELQQQAYGRYIQEANSVGLSSDLAQKVMDGAIDIDEYDEDTRDLINKFKEFYENALDCSDAIQQLHEDLADLYSDNFSNIADVYSNQLSLLEHLTMTYETGLDRLDTKGYLETKTYYAALKDVEEQNISVLQNELSALTKSFSEAMNSGEIAQFSDEWYSMQAKINGVKETIQEAGVALLEYDKTMRELDWSYFDYAQNRISQLTQEADFLVDLMSNGDLYDDRGQFSNTGTATMGLHAQNYGTYMAQADMYAKEMERINQEIAEDPYNDDLIQRREELLELQQESILAAEDEKQAIADLVEDGINIELDALKDLIDTYEDSLDSARDLYKYQKDVADQTSEIASLQKQLSAYAGDTSEETRATVQRLQVDLMAAQDELYETEYDQYISDQKKLLDDLYTEYESILNQRLDDVDALLLDMIDSANLNAASINETLHEVSDNVGYTMTDNLQNIWSAENDELVGVLTKYGDGFLENMTSLNAVLGTVNASLSDGFVSILDKLRKMLGESDDEAKVGIDTSGPTTSTDPNVKAPTTQSTQPSSTPTTATTSSNPSTPTKTIKVGGMINAKGAPIYDYAGDKSGEHQYFSSDPIYKVLSEKNGYLSVRWHKLSSGVTGWFKKSDVKAYASGGYVYNTGPAWVDGTPQKPEAFLDARDTENIGRLRDTLRMLAPRRLTITDSPPGDLLGISPVVNGVRDISALQASVIGRSGENMGTNVGRVENNIDIHVDHVEDYDDFMNQLVADKKFEKFIQAATVGRLTGKSDPLTKYKYKW